MGDTKIFNVLHVVSRLPVGGVEKSLLKVVTNYDPKQFNARICCIREGGDVEHLLKAAGFEVKVLNRMKGHGFDWLAVQKLYKVIKEEQIDVLRTHEFHANLYGRIAGALAGVPVIVPSFHSLYATPSKPKLHRLLLNFLLGFFSDSIVAVSGGVAKDIERFDRIRADKIRVIHNGIEPQFFEVHGTKAEARQKFNLPQDCMLVGTVGRLKEEKDHRTIIMAAEGMNEICLVFAGEGPLRKDLADLAASHSVKCIFTGSLAFDDVPIFLKALDIFCFPSLWEGFGTALVEAMAVGLPVAASDIPPIREVVDDAALLFPPGDSARLRDALKRFMEEGELREKLGAKARTRAENFLIKNTVRGYESLFLEILGRKGLLT